MFNYLIVKNYLDTQNELGEQYSSKRYIPRVTREKTYFQYMTTCIFPTGK